MARSQSWGVLLIVGFCAMGGAADVVVGNRVQLIDTFSLLFYSFVVTAAFFMALKIKHMSAVTKLTAATWKYVVGVNVLSVALWVGYFFSVRYLEPAVTTAIVFGIGPVVSRAFSRYGLRTGNQETITEKILSWLALAGTGLLVTASICGKTGFAPTDPANVLIGILAGAICGTAVVLYTFLSKKMNTLGWDPQGILAVRYPLLIALSGIMVATHDRPMLWSTEIIGSIIGVAILSHIIPPLFLQIGIQYVPALTVSLVLVLKPLLTFAAQTFDDRLRFSAVSLILIVIIIVLLIALTLTKKKRNQS